MPQRGRKSSLIVSVLLPVALIEEIRSTIASQNLHTLRAPLNQSEWIRRAIEREIAHAKRSRRSASPRKASPGIAVNNAEQQEPRSENGRGSERPEAGSHHPCEEFQAANLKSSGGASGLISQSAPIEPAPALSTTECAAPVA